MASEWAGWKNYLSCEINEFGNKVLNHYWPEAYHHTDIKTLTYDTISNELSKRFGTDWRNDDIIISGGFPCQPFSTAGKRLGKEDERHLWPEMLRVIREVRPKYVVGENVRGLLSWSDGLVLEEVYADLEGEGYEVQPFVLPAVGINAPHRRDRVYIIATDTKCQGREKWRQNNGWQYALGNAEQGNGNGNATDTKCIRLEHSKEAGNIREGKTKTQRERSKFTKPFETNGINGNATNTDGNGQPGKKHRNQETGQHCKNSQRNDWHNFPTQSPICGGDDGLPTKLDGITFSKWRNESIKAYGNAIVPQVAYQIFKAIQETI